MPLTGLSRWTWAAGVLLRESSPLRFFITTELTFTPRHEDEEAGLCLYLAEDFHARIALYRERGQRWIGVRRRAADLEADGDTHAAPEGPVLLRVDGDWEAFSFYLGTEEHWTLLATADRRLLCTELARGWTGLVAALYATGSGRPAETDARFSWVEHRSSHKPLGSEPGGGGS